MLRFIMIKRERLVSGAEREIYYTIDDNLSDVEKALTAGGTSESEYETHALVGIEVLPAKEAS